MSKIITITFMILSATALAYSPERDVAIDTNPGCIVQPDVIEACEKSGGRFDYKLCSCVGGSELQ